MLVRFIAKNFLSFKEGIEFNMIPDSQKWHKDHIYEFKNLELLKTAALYGANGAGKSNLIKGISTLKKLILKGTSEMLEIRPFKLEAGYDELPTSFEIEFVKDGCVYLYGLNLKENTILEEWLYESGLGKEDLKLFTRKTDNGQTTIDVSPDFIKSPEDELRIKLYQTDFLKDNVTFLKLISESKESIGKIKNAFLWFKENLLVVFPRTRPVSMAERMTKSANFKLFADTLICSMHTGISKIEITQDDLDLFFGNDDKETADSVKKDLNSGQAKIINLRATGFNEEIIALLDGDKPVIRRLIYKHSNKNGDLVDFSIDEESDGTIRLFHLVPAIYSAINGDNCVIIDEIDHNIHPSLLKELVKKFSCDTNAKGQLIFTTHEANLLDQEIFRRDEIWFVEKDKTGATTMYPLSDYEIRADLDIKKGYLQGRFGGIPFLSNLTDLNWDQYVKAEPSV